jgi:hypothetical protein
MMKPVTYGPFTKGVDASAGVLSQPKGSFPRGSNLLLTKRGALHTCDGSAGILEFNGIPTAGRGKLLVLFLYQPIGVANYYLALAQALDLPIGPPQNLTAVVSGPGGILPTATYFYRVTASDGVGGETTVSNEASVPITLGQSALLTWNIVPNAASYNVYRSTSSGTEILISGAGLPVSQNGFGSSTVSFTDTGTATGMSYTITSARIAQVSFSGPLTTYTATFTVGSTFGLTIGTQFTPSGTSNPGFDVAWKVQSLPLSGSQFTATHVGIIGGFGVGTSTTGGTFGTSNPPPSGPDVPASPLASSNVGQS